jgi:hypothetical protein
MVIQKIGIYVWSLCWIKIETEKRTVDRETGEDIIEKLKRLLLQPRSLLHKMDGEVLAQFLSH